MKIIQVMPEFGLAGAETMCENLVYELRKLGHEVIVLSMYDYHSPITDRLEAAGIDIRYLNKKSGFDFSMIAKMYDVFKKEKPDAIHTHRYVMQYAVPAAIFARVKRRVHTVHNIASKEVGRVARKLNKIFYKVNGVVPVALSDLIRDSIMEEYNMNKDSIPVILNGINLSQCVPKSTYSTGDRFIILHVGRFSEQKNHKALLKAFKCLNSKFSDLELWLIGDGEKKQETITYTESNDLTACVKFLGLQSNVYDYMNQADLFTLPSNYEGIPITIIEAMGTGLPIVASSVGGVPDMIVDRQSGLLCEAEADDIANKIESMIIDQSLREKCGKEALRISPKFSVESMTAAYVDVYSKRNDSRTY